MFTRAIETKSEAHLKDCYLKARRTLYHTTLTWPWNTHRPAYVTFSVLRVINQPTERESSIIFASLQ